MVEDFRAYLFLVAQAAQSFLVNQETAIEDAVLLGVAMSVATGTLYYHTIPYTHYLMRSMFVNGIKALPVRYRP